MTGVVPKLFALCLVIVNNKILNNTKEKHRHASRARVIFMNSKPLDVAALSGLFLTGDNVNLINFMVMIYSGKKL